MKWLGLKRKARKLGYRVNKYDDYDKAHVKFFTMELLVKNNIRFYTDGTITFGVYGKDRILMDKTYDEMYQIMCGLEN
jgi:hypothetical protein